jgi:hypothetical protein
MKNFSLVIFTLTIILLSNIKSKNLHKHKKHRRSSTQHKSKAMTKQDILAYDNCVVEYNAALFCKFDYPNDPTPQFKDCIRDNIKLLKKSEFCVTCIRKFFTKLLNKVNIFVSLSNEDPNSYNPEIEQVRKESKKFIFDLLLFTTKNCESIPKNLEQAYFDFIKLTETTKCKPKADHFVSRLEKIFANAYSGPEVSELNACPKVKSVADAVYSLLSTPCDQEISNERQKEKKEVTLINQRVESKKSKEKDQVKEKEAFPKHSQKKFRLVADLGQIDEQIEEPSEPAIQANNRVKTKNNQQEEPFEPAIQANNRVISHKKILI